MPPEALAKLRAATAAVLADLASANPNVAAVLSGMSAYAKANQSWWNVGPIERASRFTGWGSAWESSLPIE